MKTMKAVVCTGKDRLALEDAPIPRSRSGEAVIKVQAGLGDQTM
jgi:D-arabinose 1-dehydrogenase-like Zn-dependent alcohol dehydrogenase